MTNALSRVPDETPPSRLQRARRAIVAFLDRLLLDRVRVRWYRYKALPRVAALLEGGTLETRPLLALPEPTFAPERPGEFRSHPSLVDVVARRPAPTFAVARLTILPPVPRELAVLREAVWDTAGRRAPPTARQRPSQARQRDAWPSAARLAGPSDPGLARPELFGVDAALESTRPEREQPPPIADEELPRLVANPPAGPLLQPSPSIAVFAPRSFGLLDSGGPPLDDQPMEQRFPPKLPRGAASFRANRVERSRLEELVPAIPTTFGEQVAEGLAGFFDAETLGAVEKGTDWELDPELDEQMKEVREQYLLRRDIGRPEMDDDEIAGLERVEGFAFDAIQTFTGLEFEDLQPEPVEPLKMRLANPTLDLAPATEAAELQLAWLMRAIREHPEEPPVPVLP